VWESTIVVEFGAEPNACDEADPDDDFHGYTGVATASTPDNQWVLRNPAAGVRRRSEHG
jgi:hypothetical protein